MMFQSKRLVVAGLCLVSTTALAEAIQASSVLPTPEMTVASSQPIDGSFNAKSVTEIPTSKETGRGFTERLALNYWGAYYSPSVGGPSDFTPNYGGSSGDVQYLDGVITADYHPTRKTLVGIGIPQIYTPLREKKGILTDNLFLRLSESKFINRGRLKLGMGSRAGPAKRST